MPQERTLGLAPPWFRTVLVTVTFAPVAIDEGAVNADTTRSGPIYTLTAAL